MTPLTKAELLAELVSERYGQPTRTPRATTPKGSLVAILREMDATKARENEAQERAKYVHRTSPGLSSDKKRRVA